MARLRVRTGTVSGRKTVVGYSAIFYDPDRQPAAKYVSLYTRDKRVAQSKLKNLEKEIYLGTWDPWENSARQDGAGVKEATTGYLKTRTERSPATIRADEMNAGEFPKGSTRRSTARASARHHGCALYVDPATALGTLYFVGEGDPSLNVESLYLIARALAAAGVRKVDRIVADDSYFEGTQRPASWPERNNHKWYGAPSSALSANYNVVAVHARAVGSERPTVWVDPFPAFFEVGNTLRSGRGPMNVRSRLLELRWAELS